MLKKRSHTFRVTEQEVQTIITIVRDNNFLFNFFHFTFDKTYRATELEVRTTTTTARDIQALLSYSLAVVWLLEMIVHIEIDSV